MRFAFLGLLFFLFQPASAQIRLSEDAEISVVTFGPYQGEVWSAFGHNGIRVRDPKYRIDWFYDYGVFDFEQENFFLNFAKGLLKYKIGVREYRHVYAFQKSLNRYIKLQYLNLTLEEKQTLFNYLQNNALPENAEYLYNYVYDNCATKIRDVAVELYPERITFDLSYKEDGKTIRDLMEDYLALQPWGDLGIDIGLGMQIDRESTATEYMFLPEYVHAAFEGATIDRDTLIVPLVKKSVVAFTPEEETLANGFLTPFNAFVLLFFIVGFITHLNMKRGKRIVWIDVILFSIVGFAGWWVTYLWIGTEHLSKNNLNILWALPWHLPLIFFLFRERFRSFFAAYFKWTGYWYAMLLIAWAMLPQPLHQSLVPLVLTLALRSFYLSYDLRKGLRPAPSSNGVN